jgi:hypothetical protein
MAAIERITDRRHVLRLPRGPFPTR